MTDGRAYDEDRLPWLEEVEDEDGPRGVSARKMLAWLLVVVAAAAIVAATFFWIGRRDGASAGAPELIRAPAGPYKVRPENPGGLDVTGESETAFQTSAGEDVDARLDTSKLPDQPQPRTEPEPSETPPPTPAERPREPSASAAPSGAVVQLGAYRNTAQAERAWTALTGRFPELESLSKIVVPYSAGGSSGYRLRAGASSPAQAQQMCQALQAAGESCFVAR